MHLVLVACSCECLLSRYGEGAAVCMCALDTLTHLLEAAAMESLETRVGHRAGLLGLFLPATSVWEPEYGYLGTSLYLLRYALTVMHLYRFLAYCRMQMA